MLVGLAEIVTESATSDKCVTKCLDSQQLYGIQCVSGEFFYDEVRYRSTEHNGCGEMQLN